jgi:4-hydroxy-tetrahydrodipicolinate reductase
VVSVARIKIGILGISGRMGQAIVKSVCSNPRVDLAGGFAKDIEKTDVEYFLTDNVQSLAEKSDILIDFTNPHILKNHLEIAVKNNKPLVIGTTGFDSDTEQFMQDTSKHIPILQSGNMSLGVNLLAKLVKQTASILDNDWDIEITESHHRHKIDSPSGTAIMLGKAAAQGRNVDFETVAKLSREGIDTPRPTGEIGFSTIRAGSIIGDHCVLFAHDSEMITLSHKAQDRTIFANGSVYAAEKLITMPAGFYTMQDILPL